MIAVSLNVGGGVRLIKPAILYMCTQKHYKHNEDGRTAPGVCSNGSVPLSHSGNVVTRIRIHTLRQGVDFGSVVEHWIIDPAARVRFPPKSWDFFRPNLLCFVLCYGFHIVRAEK